MSRFPFRSFQPREPQHRRNGKIRAREVRVIDEEKNTLGVMPLGDALRLAQKKGLDLIEIAPNATPPVCRIVDYGKFRYEESKREKDSQGKQATHKMKEIQLTPSIDPHDMATKLAHAIGFLSEDMKVLVKLRFRGRQRAHKEYGFQVINKFITDAASYGQVDAPPKMLGDRDLNVILRPLSREKRGHQPRPPKPAAATLAPPRAEPTSEKPDDGRPPTE
jgi:translation initiation factor IF-3